jgi:hypothetical protein
MTTGDFARRLLLCSARAVLGAAVVGGATPACFTAGGGTSPPPKSFYFPTGLAVSNGGNVLYAVNSDFDLQWTGGTLQSYDLFHIRRHAAELIDTNLDPAQANAQMVDTRGDPQIPFVSGSGRQGRCRGLQISAPRVNPDGTRVPLGQACSPPVDSTQYVIDSYIIGAFAEDLQLSLATDNDKSRRLFAPVSGDATLTWGKVGSDDNPMAFPMSFPATHSEIPASQIDCGDVGGRCDAYHHAGSDPNQAGNTRNVTMPGEPFGMAQTEDGSAIAITHESNTETSLLTTGFGSTSDISPSPSMQFVVQGVPVGGTAITAVPHDPYASVPPCTGGPTSTLPCVRPAFLQTSRSTAEVDLLRYYDDDWSSLHRPFLVRERAYALNVNNVGSDSRGIAIDPTPRLACKWRAFQTTSPSTSGMNPLTTCAQLPARVFIANRSPPTLIVAEIGAQPAVADGTYDPDLLVFKKSIPISDGPARVYLAPIVDATGRYALRVFVVCFDASTIFVFDPDNLEVAENVIYVGPGPFAMAFDPFSMDDVADHLPVPPDGRPGALCDTGPGKVCELKRYRFAYVASFTQSFVQLIDLDRQQSPETFESVVFTLGKPTPPKGT